MLDKVSILDCHTTQDLKNITDDPRHFETYFLPGVSDPPLISDKLMYRSKEVTLGEFAKYMKVTIHDIHRRLKKFDLSYLAVILGARRWSCSDQSWTVIAIERYKYGGKKKHTNPLRTRGLKKWPKGEFGLPGTRELSNIGITEINKRKIERRRKEVQRKKELSNNSAKVIDAIMRGAETYKEIAKMAKLKEKSAQQCIFNLHGEGVIEIKEAHSIRYGKRGVGSHRWRIKE